MLGGTWLLITALLLVTAAILRQVPLLMVALLFFLTSGVARLWARYALERVEYVRHLSATRVLFGETVTLEIHVTNRKLLPLPWLEIQDEVPGEISFLKANILPSHKPARVILSNYLSLGWYRKLIRRYPFQCLRRGYFTFGPTTLRSGDLFGFFQNAASVETPDRLLVYPRIVSLDELGIPSRAPFGDLRVRRHLFEDPVRVVSTRDYVHGDPLKRIHWKATARIRRLQSRVFEPTTSVDLALFLDVRTVAPPLWGSSEQLLETAVITAASVANHAVEKGYRVGLYANESYRYSDRVIKLPPSDSPHQLMHLLEALAQVQGWPIVPIEQILNVEGRSLPWGATMTVITAVPSASLMASLNRFRRAGRRVSLIIVGGDMTQFSQEGIPVYHVSDQVYSQQLDSLQLLSTGNGRRLEYQPDSTGTAT